MNAHQKMMRILLKDSKNDINVLSNLNNKKNEAKDTKFQYPSSLKQITQTNFANSNLTAPKANFVKSEIFENHWKNNTDEAQRQTFVYNANTYNNPQSDFRQNYSKNIAQNGKNSMEQNFTQKNNIKNQYLTKQIAHQFSKQTNSYNESDDSRFSMTSEENSRDFYANKQQNRNSNKNGYNMNMQQQRPINVNWNGNKMLPKSSNHVNGSSTMPTSYRNSGISTPNYPGRPQENLASNPKNNQAINKKPNNYTNLTIEQQRKINEVMNSSLNLNPNANEHIKKQLLQNQKNHKVIQRENEIHSKGVQGGNNMSIQAAQSNATMKKIPDEIKIMQNFDLVTPQKKQNFQIIPQTRSHDKKQILGKRALIVEAYQAEKKFKFDSQIQDEVETSPKIQKKAFQNPEPSTKPYILHNNQKFIKCSYETSFKGHISPNYTPEILNTTYESY